MGTRAIIAVLALMAVVITVSIHTMGRQQKSKDELKDLDYSQEVRHLANSQAEMAVSEFHNNPEMMDTVNFGESRIFVDQPDHSLSIVRDGLDHDGNSIFRVISSVTITDNDATAYTATTEVFMGYGGSFMDTGSGDGDSPMTLDLTGLPAGALWIRIEANGITMNVANNNSGKNMHQFPSQLDMNHFLHVSRADIEASGNVVICPPIPSGIVQVSGHNMMMSPANANWKIPYPFTLFIENPDVKIDGHLLSDFEINIVSTGKITYSGVDKSPDPINMSPTVHLWANTTITVPASKPATKGLLDPNKHQNANNISPEDFMVHNGEEEEEEPEPEPEEEEVILPPRIQTWVEHPVVKTKI
ncbi:MAG: hypothetical protein FWG20_04845 [Candidatus Cloacimonetes bacterium]|nr:hypothetical protein [Candidatus Cloacimonadota bacterium]